MRYATNKHWLGALAVLFTAIATIPTVNNGWLRWDDHIYILSNPFVQQFNWESILGIFTTYSYNGGYTPLPMLSWALDNWMFGNDAFHFHLTNFILHLCNVLLCFLFIRQLTSDYRIAFFVATLFGLHPMHLEPVAWITGRKDLLMGFFTMLSLLAWQKYLYVDSKHLLWFFCALTAFILALLSKGTAVVVPVWFLLLALYHKRKLSFREITVQIPFWTIALLFGVLAIISQQKASALDSLLNVDFGESILWSAQALGTYAIKMLIPYHIGPYHPYPLKHSSFLVISGVVVLFFALIFFSFTRNSLKGNTSIFGISFMLVGLLPILQFIPVGFALTADRYAYLPFIGGYLIIAHFISSDETATAIFNQIKSGFLLVFICALGYQTRTHAKVWSSDETLWTYEIEHHGHAPRAYVNRGQFYLNKGEFQRAIDDFDEAIAQESKLKEAHQQKGLAFQALREYGAAEVSFSNALQIDSTYVPALLNLALNSVYQNDKRIALNRLRTAQKLEPNNILVLLNLGLLLRKKEN